MLTFELAQFVVRDGAEEALLAERPAMVRALREAFPTMLAAWLTREDDGVYHTYSTYARGLDVLWGMYQWLDRAPRGRNETGIWFRRHDEYDSE